MITKDRVVEESCVDKSIAGTGMCVKSILEKNNMSVVSILILILIYLTFND